MKKTILYLSGAVMVAAISVSCDEISESNRNKNAADTISVTEEEKQKVVELEKATEEISEETEEMKQEADSLANEVDELLQDI